MADGDEHSYITARQLSLHTHLRTEGSVKSRILLAALGILAWPAPAFADTGDRAGDAGISGAHAVVEPPVTLPSSAR